MKYSVSPTTTADTCFAQQQKQNNAKFEVPVAAGRSSDPAKPRAKERLGLHGTVRYGHVFCAFRGQAAHLHARGSHQVTREATSWTLLDGPFSQGKSAVSKLFLTEACLTCFKTSSDRHFHTVPQAISSCTLFYIWLETRS